MNTGWKGKVYTALRKIIGNSEHITNGLYIYIHNYVVTPALYVAHKDE